MNLRTRIAKIEKAMMPGSGFCSCRDVKKTEIWFADLSEKSHTIEPWFEGKAVPDVCARCNLRIEKKQFILQLCDQTTKDRFPEEWNKENYEI